MPENHYKTPRPDLSTPAGSSPLNAANANYYIAPVFYEWNVYDLFERKVEAAIRSDSYIRTRLRERGIAELGEVNYATGSADAIDLGDGSNCQELWMVA